MTERLPSGVLVSALLRRVNDAGGMGMVRARGDAQAGALIIILYAKGAAPKLLERSRHTDGRDRFVPAGPGEEQDEETIERYWRRRRERDRDLWVVELDIPSAERFAAETILAG